MCLCFVVLCHVGLIWHIHSKRRSKALSSQKISHFLHLKWTVNCNNRLGFCFYFLFLLLATVFVCVTLIFSFSFWTCHYLKRQLKFCLTSQYFHILRTNKQTNEKKENSYTRFRLIECVGIQFFVIFRWHISHFSGLLLLWLHSIHFPKRWEYFSSTLMHECVFIFAEFEVNFM